MYPPPYSESPPSTDKYSLKAYIRSYIGRISAPDDSIPAVARRNLGEQRYPLIDMNGSNKPKNNPTSTTITDNWEPGTLSLKNVADEVYFPHTPWRPTWLRRRVFFAFAAWFVALAVILEPLLSVSQRASGIASPKENLYYLWTFGPTAVFSVTAALWGRVDYQTMRFMPWIQMSKGTAPARGTVLLDYNSMVTPIVILSSFRNRHYLVTSSILVTLALKVLIVLSSSLILLQHIPMTVNNAAFAVQDRFSADLPLSSLIQCTASQGTTVRSSIGEFLDLNRTAPTGYYKSPQMGVAYQIFDSEAKPLNASLKAIVDGVWSELECEPATNIFQLDTFEPTIVSGYGEGPGVNISMESSYCDAPVIVDVDAASFTESTFLTLHTYFGPGGGVSTNRSHLGRYGTRVSLCTGTTGPVMLYGQFHMEILDRDSDNSLDTAAFINGTAVFCKPTYLLGKVEVSNPGPDSEVALLPHFGTRSISGDITWNLFSTVYGYLSTDPTETDGEEYDPAGSFESEHEPEPFLILDLSYGFQILGKPDWEASTITADEIIRGWTAFYGWFASLWAHHCLRESEESTIRGSFSQYMDRLLVQPISAHIMAGLLFALASLVIINGIFLVPQRSFMPKNPETIPGTIIALSNSQNASGTLSNIAALSSQGGLDRDSICWTDSRETADHGRPAFFLGIQKNVATRAPPACEEKSTWYQPWTLKTIFRIFMSLFLLCLILILAFLLRKSLRWDGIGTADRDSKLYYLWTSLPTLLLSGVGLYFTSADHQTRFLAPYLLLRQKALAVEYLTTSLADRSALPALLTAIRRRAFPSILSTITSILVTISTIFAATLFVESSVPASSAILMQQEEWFAFYYNDTMTTDILVYSGVLMNDPSTIAYPAGTYEDLLFPSFSVSQPPEAPTENMTISITVPGMRPALSCVSLSQQDLSFNLRENDTTSYYNITIPKSIPSVWDIDQCGLILSNGTYGIDETAPENFYNTIDTVSWRPAESSGYYFRSATWEIPTECSTSQFLWGFFNTSTLKFDHLSAYICQDWIEDVDIELNLLWPSLDLDPQHPPTPIESSARPATRLWPLSAIMRLNTIPLQTIANFTSKRYHINETALSDPAQEEAVLKVQKDWWKIIISDTLNEQLRLFYNETATKPEIENLEYHGIINVSANGPSNLTKPLPINATITDWTNRRIVQKPTPTYILIGLLSTILLMNLISTWIGPRRPLLPKDPGTIAAMADLFLHSNVFEHLPHQGAEWLSASQLRERLNGLAFRLGWFHTDGDGQETAYTVGLVNAMTDDKNEPYSFAKKEA